MLLAMMVESEIYFSFQKNDNLHVVIDERIVSTVPVELLSKCASACTKNGKCRSFAFNDDIHQCKTYSVFNKQSLPRAPTTSVGWRHYTIMDAG